MNSTSTDPVYGTLLQMQDYSIHDGDGVRTTLFLAGCGLRCQWCANPESWTRQPKLAWYAHRCRDCGRCSQSCPAGRDPRKPADSQPACRHCGNCISHCPSGALSMACRKVSTETVYEQLKRDEIFFRYSGGGVTFSGGEPFLQPQFIRALMQRCGSLSIGFQAETCGYFRWSAVDDLIPQFDHIYFDIKHMDPQQHRRLTGVSNVRILANAGRIRQRGIPVTVRIPLLPEINGDDDNLTQTARFMQQTLPDSRIELLPYHDLGRAKYSAFNMHDKFHPFRAPDAAETERAYGIFAEYGIERVTE